MEWVVIALVIVLIWMVVRTANRQSEGQTHRKVSAADLEKATDAAAEDVTRFGEELQTLDLEVQLAGAQPALVQDWQRALDSYDTAKRALDMVERPDDVRHVTTALEDGRYAVACVRARRAGEPLPQRRPPCFFNPTHGPSTTDVEWAPPGGQQRRIPVCAADADRLAQGAEPDIRTVPSGPGRVPYWQGGSAYSPWAMGYFGTYAATGLLPGFLLGSLLSSDWDGSNVDGFDQGGTTDSGGADSGGSDAGDSAGDYGDAGGDYGSGDFGSGDFGGGDFGGF